MGCEVNGCDTTCTFATEAVDHRHGSGQIGKPWQGQ